MKHTLMTGIDIQPEGIQLAQIRHQKQQYTLQKLSTCPLETAIFADNKITNWDHLTNTLFDWIQDLGLNGSVTTVALPAQWVRLLHLHLPTEPTEAAIYKHLEQEFPGLHSTLMVDYYPLPPQQSDQHTVMIAIAKRDYLDHYIGCLTDAGLQVKIVDVDTFALQRAMQCDTGTLLWQQRKTFTLIWHDEQGMPRQAQWPALSATQAISNLSQHLEQYRLKSVRFCGSRYYTELFNQSPTLSPVITNFMPTFIRTENPLLTNGINLSDYLLAIGLAMREVPLW